MIIEYVYKSSDNPNTVVFSEDGTPIDFSNTTRMVLSFAGSSVEADTDVTSSLIDWTNGDGEVEFNINDLDISSEKPLPATLVNYDPDHTDGQVLVHAEDNQLLFKFIDV